MQVHYGFDVKRIGTQAVNDGVGKTAEVKLAILAPDLAPTSRFGRDAPHRALKLVQESAAQARLPFLIPKRRALEFFVSFRMADDAHGSYRGCPAKPAPPDGN